MDGDVVSVQRVIMAPTRPLFAIVADPTRHPEFDGSGAVVKAKEGAPHALSLGATFGMAMKLGIPYVMANTVVECEPDRRIAWKTVVAGPLGRWVGGRIWRFELEPAEGGTLVRESWDISQDKQATFLRRGKVPSATADNMTTSLQRLGQLVEGAAR
jgi:hypothetical protein